MKTNRRSFLAALGAVAAAPVAALAPTPAKPWVIDPLTGAISMRFERPLKFHRDAFAMVMPMPARVDVLYGYGVGHALPDIDVSAPAKALSDRIDALATDRVLEIHGTFDDDVVSVSTTRRHSEETR